MQPIQTRPVAVRERGKQFRRPVECKVKPTTIRKQKRKHWVTHHLQHGVYTLKTFWDNKGSIGDGTDLDRTAYQKTAKVVLGSTQFGKGAAQGPFH